MTDVKIKCDSCKFVDGCVDYGWSECKKFTQKPSEPITNREWLQTATTEQLAEWIVSEINERVKLALHDSELNDGDVDADFYMEDSDDWKEWLKQPHDNI